LGATLCTRFVLVAMHSETATETSSFQRPLLHLKKEAEPASETLCFQYEVIQGQ